MQTGDFTPIDVQDERPVILFVGDHDCFSDIYLRLIGEEFSHYRIACDRNIEDATSTVKLNTDRIAFIVICSQFGELALKAIRAMALSAPNMRPVLAYSNTAELREVLEANGDPVPLERLSFLPMQAKIDAVISIIHLLISGECHVSSDVVKLLLDSDCRAGSRDDIVTRDVLIEPNLDGCTPSIDVGKLTSRELEVLALLSGGAPNKTIAEQLGLSPSTVKLHIHHIIAKLKVRNRTEAAVAYLRSKLAIRSNSVS